MKKNLQLRNNALRSFLCLLGIIQISFSSQAQVSIDSVRHGDTHIGSRSIGNLVYNGDFEYPIQPMVYLGGSANNNNSTPGTIFGSNDCGGSRYGIPRGTLSGWTVSGGGSRTYMRIDTSDNSVSFAASYVGNGTHNIYMGNGGPYYFANTNSLTYNDTTGLINLNGNSLVIDPAHAADSLGTIPVSISQTISVTPGAQYMLEFFVSGEAAACGAPSPPDLFRFDVGGNVMYGYTGSNTSVLFGASERYYVYFKSSSSTVTISFINYGHLWLDATKGIKSVFPTYAYTGCSSGSPSPWCPYTTSEIILDDIMVNQTIAAPLPLHLLSFEAKYEDAQHVQLKWTSASEKGYKNYIIQRSYNGTDWESVHAVDIQEQPSSSYEYLYTDKIAGAVSNVFYRLQFISIEGKTEYSNTLILNRAAAKDQSASVQVYPNPNNSSQHTSVRIEGFDKAVEGILSNLDGKVFWKGQLQQGDNKVLWEGLPVGNYFLYINDAANTISTKIIITD